MQLTKFEHSCFMLESHQQSIIFDPGKWSSGLAVPSNVAAIILTHEHSDHFDESLLNRIVASNPGAVVVAPHDLGEKLPHFSLQSVGPGDDFVAGPFHLQFSGGEHAPIHPEIAGVTNLAVLVNDSFYYPGDSFALPERAIKTLALPVTAPWLKISQAIDFMIETRPELAFPVHDHIASTDGKRLVDDMLSGFAQKHDIHYQRLQQTVLVD